VQPSHLISVVLHHARRYRAESDGVNRDGVTGLLNYGSLSHALRALMKGQDALTLALLDVTQFAEINRRFGEKAGDQVLRRIAHQLRLHLGQQTLLARMSGDTFAVVFPGLNGDIARSRIETVQRSISGIRHEIDQQAFNINCRAGLACSPPATDLEQLLYAAEQALQQARTVGPAAIGGCS